MRFPFCCASVCVDASSTVPCIASYHSNPCFRFFPCFHFSSLAALTKVERANRRQALLDLNILEDDGASVAEDDDFEPIDILSMDNNHGSDADAGDGGASGSNSGSKSRGGSRPNDKDVATSASDDDEDEERKGDDQSAASVVPMGLPPLPGGAAFGGIGAGSSDVLHSMLPGGVLGAAKAGATGSDNDEEEDDEEDDDNNDGEESYDDDDDDDDNDGEESYDDDDDDVSLHDKDPAAAVAALAKAARRATLVRRYVSIVNPC